MSFKVSARTVFQLGAELISSDGIAFYELIKNAIDASKDLDEEDRKVNVNIVIRMPYKKIHLADCLRKKILST